MIFIFLLAVTLFALTLGGKSFSAVSLVSLPPVLGLLQFGISPLLEELLFRGMVMKELMTLLPTYLATALTSLLFVGIHLPFWLSHGGANPGDADECHWSLLCSAFSRAGCMQKAPQSGLRRWRTLPTTSCRPC